MPGKEDDMTTDYRAGQRFSLKGQSLTIKYVGSVHGKSGDWLGVEWDDVSRGKHDGVHEGKKYLECRSSSPTCASFLRPKQTWDPHRTFLEALREKYVARTKPTESEVIYFASKQAEEVGFDKFAKRQAELRGIHVLVLDRMCMRHSSHDPDVDTITSICQEITDLDIGGNLFESLSEVHDLCRRLPKLRSLTLNGNRMSLTGIDQVEESSFDGIRTLSLANTLLDWESELVSLVKQHFPSLNTLLATNNSFEYASPNGDLPASLKTLDLSGNNYATLTNLSGVASSCVQTLLLKDCKITVIAGTAQEPHPVFTSVQELDIRRNNISEWSFFDHLLTSIPSLKHLRTTGNPLYTDLKTHDGKLLTAEDGYMLTIARLPTLGTLNYSKITDKERLNAETYYLGLIAAELRATATDKQAVDIRKHHPRYAALCETYGEPDVSRKTVLAAGDLDPDSLAARLVKITFVSGAVEWTEELPKSFSMYAILGVVGKKLGVMPLRLRLVLETGERDPVGMASEGYGGPEWWHSDDEDSADEDGRVSSHAGGTDQASWVAREVEMPPGTRALGTYVEGMAARVRVETRQ
ncbi:hypothetical protein LTR56_021236 [Elasticomyces elasticus]|nr:hypothetical protein LTR56_021236 [Elasticomyces elasticus]KAK3663566.1 hypothetical protein LTR22_005506 [Elasticomyces elasticus]KAK4923564.1 hypothetical protein LTR49_009277 [Elasticomyces elasticus]KAK5751578.1 hypothetical protein LTS12_018351 [Elasticomyces elasticus]